MVVIRSPPCATQSRLRDRADRDHLHACDNQRQSKFSRCRCRRSCNPHRSGGGKLTTHNSLVSRWRRTCQQRSHFRRTDEFAGDFECVGSGCRDLHLWLAQRVRFTTQYGSGPQCERHVSGRSRPQRYGRGGGSLRGVERVG